MDTIEHVPALATNTGAIATRAPAPRMILDATKAARQLALKGYTAARSLNGDIAVGVGAVIIGVVAVRYGIRAHQRGAPFPVDQVKAWLHRITAPSSVATVTEIPPAEAVIDTYGFDPRHTPPPHHTNGATHCEMMTAE